MATYETSRPAPFGAVATLQIINVFDTVVTNVKAWNLARKTEAELNALSDRQLEDIGIARSQINTTALELVARRYF